MLHPLDLCSCPAAHHDICRWSDGLTAVISCFLGLKLPGCESHNSACHPHPHPSHTIAGASTTWIYIAMAVKKKCTLRGVKLADQNRDRPRPSSKKDSQIGSLLPSIKTATDYTSLRSSPPHSSALYSACTSALTPSSPSPPPPPPPPCSRAVTALIV